MIEIRPFNPAHTNDVIAMILPIQQVEFSLPVTIEHQPDLLKIPEVYQDGRGNFWTALDGDKVVGTIALLDTGNNIGGLKKMFVRKNYRGPEHHIARRLLETLLEWAREKGFKDIYLGTTEVMTTAHRFYEKNGFVEVERKDLPNEKFLAVVDKKFYHLTL
ncbi:GNAT family N-acetyltransferase [Chitinophaga sp. GCM10012297]|uniref:GNAT family N-acetyltransferase n=1 Tax=Chitinophaga chungangae TaxID=2821488 RepID=A0ABS3YK84_9BACT|nr:GNAT family N-acetyltransferase [Chitinophaga chungangae]MBO9155099.1 GNAT family N-acetyltransferase [Chitinophaga chungangae]